MKSAETKTNATRLLELAGIEFQTINYEVDENDLSGVKIAAQLKQDPASIFKTLIMKGEKNGYFICCLPVADELDLKKVARAFGDKKVDLIPTKELKDLTGYIRGGCSPIGTKKKFPTFIDETAILFNEIFINAGIRGTMILVESNALIQFLGAQTVDLVKD